LLGLIVWKTTGFDLQSRGTPLRRRRRGSAASDDADDFQAIASGERAGRELRGRDGFTVQFHDNATGGQSLLNKEFFKGTREMDCAFNSVGNNQSHVAETLVQTCRVWKAGSRMKIALPVGMAERVGLWR